MVQNIPLDNLSLPNPGGDVDEVDEPLDALESLTLAQLEQRIQVHREEQRIEVGPTRGQQLGWVTVVCLILNRTIGTGIFAQPVNVLFLTGSSGVAILLWFVGGAIILVITLSWLELGLTVPRHYIRSAGEWFSTPRSGGDKNYLEYIYKKPKLLMTCVFGITFIVFGNLAGNAIQFGVFMQAGISPHCTEDDECFNKAAVILWAIGILTLCSLLNIITRRLFITINNAFAIVKYLLVLVTALLGIAYGTSHGDFCRKNITWAKQGPGGEFGDIALAIFFAMYSYTGFEQPFYVLAEVKHPKRIFAPSVLTAVVLVLILFPLTNVGYLCVVPYTGGDSLPDNMALKFFDIIARIQNPNADTTGSQQAVSLILALFIFGTIMAQTFTGTRVKQEIGKEAILPWSLFIASGSDSLLGRLTTPQGQRNKPFDNQYIEDHPEQVPVFATVLHIIFAVLLVLLVGVPVKPSTAYRILTFLRIFSIIVVLGLLTVAGLAYLKIDGWLRGAKGRNWYAKRQWRPWLDPLPTVAAVLALAFCALAIFASPSQIRDDDVPYWFGPLIGWAILLLGVVWWLGLRYWQWKTRSSIEVHRWPHVVIDQHGEAIMKAEVIEHRPSRVYAQRAGRDFAQD